MGKGKTRFGKASNKDQGLFFERKQEEGWSVSRAQNGHFRLDHPEASRPVFTSSTPSCRHALAKMDADCRRVLRRSETAIPALFDPDFEMIPLDNISGLTRKLRWSDEDRLRRDAQIEISMSTSVAVRLATETCHAEPADIVRDDGTVPSVPAMDEVLAEPVQTRLATGPTDPSLLDVALSIMTGRMASLTITPDMIGKTIAFSAPTCYLVEPISPTVTAPHPEAHPSLEMALIEALSAAPETGLRTTQLVASARRILNIGTSAEATAACRDMLDHLWQAGRIARADTPIPTWHPISTVKMAA